VKRIKTKQKDQAEKQRESKIFLWSLNLLILENVRLRNYRAEKKKMLVGAADYSLCDFCKSVLPILLWLCFWQRGESRWAVGGGGTFSRKNGYSQIKMKKRRLMPLSWRAFQERNSSLYNCQSSSPQGMQARRASLCYVEERKKSSCRHSTTARERPVTEHQPNQHE